MKLYEKMRNGENLSWCRPFTTKHKNLWVIVKEGKIEAIHELFGHIYFGQPYAFVNPSENLIAEFARIYNKNYYANKDYFTPTEILLDVLYEKGCADCPFRDECEAMEDSGENNERV